MCCQLQAQLLRKYWNLVLQLKCVPELTGQMVSSTYTDLKINTERHKKGNEPKYSPLTARTFQGCLTSKESWRRWPPAGQGRGQCCTELVHCPQKAKSSYLFQNHEPLTARCAVGTLMLGYPGSSPLLPSPREIRLSLAGSILSVCLCYGIPVRPYLALMITRLISVRRNFKSLTIQWD